MVSRFRFTIIILGIFGAFAYLIYGLHDLQIKRGSYFSNRAESQYKLAGFLEPHRGIIYLTDKEKKKVPAALNKSYPVIFAVPKEIKDVKKTSQVLASILDQDEAELNKNLARANSLYRLLQKKATQEQVEKINKADLEGVYVDQQELRFYPFGSLAAHILGFIAPNEQDDTLRGRYGLERYFNNRLSGTPGRITGDKITRPQQGEDLSLTIDRNIQEEAERILKKLVDTYQAQQGMVIVQNPKTGNILSLGAYPAFDPNEYSKTSLKIFLNPVTQSIYEPGSIFKVITMASALDAGAITPTTTYYDSGSLTLNGRTIRNWDLKAHGQITMTQVIEKSLNTGSAYAGRQLGGDKFYDYLTKFGFTEKTNIQLSDEVVGDVEQVKKPRPIHLATASFGQGISVTPIALINAISAIANKGTLMKPNILQSNKPQRVRRVISKKAAQEITIIMTSAVKKARVAQVANYKVAGKTGTAQVPDFKKGGYTDDVINTYIGFAPSSDAQFVIFIRIDKPLGAPLAGQTVVPAFRELAEFILNYYNIAPDNLPES